MDQQKQAQPPAPQMPPQATPPSGTHTNVFLIAGVIIVCAGIGIYLMSGRSPAPTPAGGSGSPTQAVHFASYKDGTYTAEGDYFTHEGPEAIQVSVTLKDGVITDSQFSATPNAPMSARFQGLFSQNYKQYVVGKNINDVNLGPISGSSLTPMGFNDAIAKIKAQAGSGS